MILGLSGFSSLCARQGALLVVQVHRFTRRGVRRGVLVTRGLEEADSKTLT